MAHYWSGLRTRLIHGSSRPDHGLIHSHVQPIYQTSTYGFVSVEEVDKTLKGEIKHDFYGRGSNPNHRHLEERICILEQGEVCQIFDSGMSAIRTALMSFVKSGDHIIAHENLYGGTIELLKVMQNFGVSITFVDARNLLNVITAIRPETRVVFLESPSNPTLDICDFLEIANLVSCAKNKIIVMMDNTFASPCNQRPLTHGVDIVIHSITKYLNGYGNHLGGAIVTSQDLMNKIWETYHVLGGVLSAADALNIAHNMMSIRDRMEKHNKNGEIIAHNLLNRDNVIERVHYPGLSSHPNHKIAVKLMSGFGGMVSFEIRDNLHGTRTKKFLNQLALDKKQGNGLITLSVSLGTIDTLICWPAHMTHARIPREERLAQRISDNLIRLSVGTEDVDDIIYSLDRGFETIS